MKKTEVLKNFDKKEQVRRKQEKGITLIALVITIIVLLILAAVSIATLTGENGILTKANKAKEETEIASEEEQRELAMIEANMNDKETTFQGVKIPAKCAPTRIKGESTVDEGLVMVDSEGNSYVWIEVPKTNEVYKTATINVTNFSEENYTAIETDLQEYTNDLQEYAQEYRNDNNYLDTWYDGCGLTEPEYKELKNKMLKSVYENEGFWVGQYEVGYEQGVGQDYRTYDGDNANSEEHPTNEKPVIKANAYPYNWVRCSQAQNLASSMSSAKCNSSLMFGIQWDLMLEFIKEKGGKTQEELTENSSNWGNYKNASFDVTKGKYSTDDGQTFTEVTGSYTKPAITDSNTSGILLTTGATKRNSVLNIYDIAGNVWEWTLNNHHITNRANCVFVGGSFVDKGNLCVYWANNYSPDHSFGSAGFRTTLY